MNGLLKSDLCGWPRGRITIIENERGPGDLPDRLITMFEDVVDVAFFYFVGHGQIDVDDELCLSLVGSRTEAHRRAATSLQFQAVRRAILGSPARTKIVILDCCSAGLANRPSNTLGTADLLDMTSGTGAYTMAACGPYATASFEDPSKKYAQTYFTKYLADTVEAGIVDEASILPLRVIFERVREKLAADGRPVPEDRIINSAGDFLFSHNAAPVPDKTWPLANAEANDEAEQLKAIIINLSRRNQSLVERQLFLLDSLENSEGDTDRLAGLFRLDHLATRMRRHSENLLVLAGHESASRHQGRPVLLLDVVRAAVAEIEQYARVDLAVLPYVQVAGPAARDVVHLLAEIVENATTFSPEDTPVYLTGAHLTTGGTLLSITDNGVGMSETEMAHANWRLDHPPAIDVAVSRRMGLFVVARLAARHGIRVRLRHEQPGLTALVWLPESVAALEQPAGEAPYPTATAVPGPVDHQGSPSL